MVFENLDKKIGQILLKKGIEVPTGIQKAAIKEILGKKNVLIVSPTGSGKTEAAFLPILNHLLQNQEKRIYCLYVTPLKALNRDLLDRLLALGTSLGIDIEVRHGDTPTSQRALQAKDPPHVLITTPETFQAILIGKRMQEHLKNVEFVLIDEIHEIINDKRGCQLMVGLERLKNRINRDFVRIGLSATVSNPEIVSKYMRGSSSKEVLIINPKDEKKFEIKIEAPKSSEEDEEIADEISTTPSTYSRIKRLYELINVKKGILVFVNTRETAEILGFRLKKLEERVSVHHGSLSKDSRIRTEKDFKSKELSAIVATSSMALGIDIGHVDLVVQYMSPRRVDAITQRVGRAGHTLAQVSEGKIFVVDPDDALEATVIADFAVSGVLEPFEVENKPLDVLANQLTAMAFERGYTPARAFETFRKTKHFELLTAAEFQDVLELMLRLRLLKVAEDGTLGIKRPAFEFFFHNLSMIKDIKKFDVVKLDSKEKIAQIDEEFGAELDLGSSFICRGLSWRVISKEEKKIFVEEAQKAYNVPEWSGELMPVEYIVASQVGNLREDFSGLESRYSRFWDEETRDLVEEDVRKCGAFPQDELGIECGVDFVVIRAFFGNKTNETLGRLLASYLSLKYGESVGLRTDPYRIFIKFPGTGYDRAFLREILVSMDEEKIEMSLRSILKNSPSFKQRFLQIAKKFGVISRDAVFSKISIQKLVDVYFGSVVFEETMNEYLFEKMDVPKTKEISKRLKEGKLKIRFLDKVTRFSERMIDKYNPEIVFGRYPRKKVLEIVKSRLEDRRMPLVCFNCKKWKSEVTVKNTGFACPSCGAKLIGVLRKESQQLLAKTDPTETEKRTLRQARKTADLYLSYGKTAFLVLAGYGIGPETAGRVLAKVGRKDEEALLGEIIKAEKTYARTRIYWSDA